MPLCIACCAAEHVRVRLLSVSAAVYRYHQLFLAVLALASAVAVFLYQSLIKALVASHSVGSSERMLYQLRTECCSLEFFPCVYSPDDML